MHHRGNNDDIKELFRNVRKSFISFNDRKYKSENAKYRVEPCPFIRAYRLLLTLLVPPPTKKTKITTTESGGSSEGFEANDFLLDVGKEREELGEGLGAKNSGYGDN
uniref:Uncharacterized protein n=1 Tax=Vespula pensylvanica TaxID=30213 RepID=A0A834MYY9_VESPE|nr:hypothetical protein H0235_017687 [Vespula pensylvanica]